MINNKIFLKKILSYLPLLNKLVRKIYSRFTNVTFFIPLDLNENVSKIVKNKIYRLNHKNFEKLNNNFNYFLIFKEKSIASYPLDKLKKLISLIKEHNADAAYDGDDFFYTEIASKKVLEYYAKRILDFNNNYSLEKYPYRFFYIKEKFVIRNIGSSHRSYNFNGTFTLPSGGKTIGDGGPVTNRLSYIPNLTEKSFLDIGSEEGYAVFDAIKKGAKYAKGLNIHEAKEYDYFPEHSRPLNITPRNRNEINATQKFLLSEHNLEKNEKIKFEYNNIYNLKDEKFDFVFCFGVLYHLKNPYLAIENLYNVTQETLILETQGIKNGNYLNAKISEEDGFIRHSSNALAYLLKRVGFKKVDILFEAYDSKVYIQNIVLKALK